MIRTRCLISVDALNDYRNQAAQRIHDDLVVALDTETDGHWLEMYQGTRTIFEHRFLINQTVDPEAALQGVIERHRDIFKRYHVAKVWIRYERRVRFEIEPAQ